MKVVLFLLIILLALLLFGCIQFPFGKANFTEFETQLCKNATLQGEYLELMRVEKCTLEDKQIYVKEESTNTVSDLGNTLIFDKNEELTCKAMYHGIEPACYTNYLSNSKKYSCEKICSTGGW